MPPSLTPSYVGYENQNWASCPLSKNAPTWVCLFVCFFVWVFFGLLLFLLFVFVCLFCFCFCFCFYFLTYPSSLRGRSWTSWKICSLRITKLRKQTWTFTHLLPGLHQTCVKVWLKWGNSRRDNYPRFVWRKLVIAFSAAKVCWWWVFTSIVDTKPYKFKTSNHAI